MSQLRLKLSERALSWLERNPARARPVAEWIRDALCDSDVEVEAVVVEHEDLILYDSRVPGMGVAVVWSLSASGTVRVHRIEDLSSTAP